MKRFRKSVLKCISVIAAAVLTVCAVSCSSDSGDEGGGKVTSVNLNSKTLTLSVNDSGILKATVNGTTEDKSVAWESSNSAVASVDKNGLVTAIKSGKTTITATATADSSKNAKCEVTVIDAVLPEDISLNRTKISLEMTDSVPLPTSTIEATIPNADKVTSGQDTITWETSPSDVVSLSAKTGASVTITAKKAGNATITAKTVNGKTASCAVTVTSTLSKNIIHASDTPTGWAEIDSSKFTTKKTVTTASDLITYAKKGGYLIYVSGTIDVSEGKLPSTAGGSTSALDTFVSKNSSYKNYEAFKTAYATSCSASTDDKSSSNPQSTVGSVLWTLNKAYGNSIKITVASNTAIIGLDGAVVKGGTFQVSNANNVVIRNLTIQDAYDPFPHHEKGDGFNAQWDNVSVTESKNVWIDHCTFEDTMLYSKVSISNGEEEKWQTYDGLCDITKSSKNVVVSYCEFKNHDKTMLIGSGSSDVSGGYITIHHNHFLNCGQRLPMTCYANMHIYNNYYERNSSAKYSQQACIAARYSTYTIIAEKNYFSSGITKAITPSTDAKGKCYIDGNYFGGGSSSCTLSTTSTKPFTPPYTYTASSASDARIDVESNAGAGKWTVQQ